MTSHHWEQNLTIESTDVSASIIILILINACLGKHGTYNSYCYETSNINNSNFIMMFADKQT
jgi:hypothetical protein